MPNFSLIAYYNRKKRCPALSGKIGMNWRKERLFFQKRFSDKQKSHINKT